MKLSRFSQQLVKSHRPTTVSQLGNPRLKATVAALLVGLGLTDAAKAAATSR